MRNYNSKPLHKQPQTSNAFRKTDRSYPDPVQVGSALKKKAQTPTNQEPVIPQKIDYQHQLSAIVPRNKSFINQKHFLYLMNPMPIIDRNSNMLINDSRCLWYKCIQKFPNRSHSIVFKQTQYIISQWTGLQYPKVVYLSLQGIWGYLNEYSIVTDRVCALTLKQISTTQNDNVIKYSLRYGSNKQSKWQIPQQVTHLKLGVKLDNLTQNLELPLPDPLLIEIDLIEQIE